MQKQRRGVVPAPGVILIMLGLRQKQKVLMRSGRYRSRISPQGMDIQADQFADGLPEADIYPAGLAAGACRQNAWAGRVYMPRVNLWIRCLA